MKRKPVLLTILSSISTLIFTSCDASMFAVGTVVDYYMTGNNLSIGDVPKNDLKIDLHLVYSNGKEKVAKNLTPMTITTLMHNDGASANRNNPLTRSGDYSCNVSVSYGDKMYEFNQTSFYVKSGFDCGYTLSNFSIKSVGSIANDEKFFDASKVEVTYEWKNHGQEIATYSSSNNNISFALYLNNTTNNVINSKLSIGQYNLVATVKDKQAQTDVNVNGGFVRINNTDLTKTEKDLSSYVSPATGNAKMLFIPISLTGSFVDPWEEEKLNSIKTYLFDGYDSHTFANYYKTASYGRLNMSGFVSEVYEEKQYTSDVIQADGSYRTLFSMIAKAVNATQERHPEIDWSEYDLDNNGTIDNVHLCTNFNTNKANAASSSAQGVWNTPLWPHKYQTNNTSGTHTSPVANVYSIDAIDHLSDAITPIHEQGHIFGLDDYYDYNYSGVDYIGAADMQSHNVFDWNCYSKLSVGWVSPYVIDGSQNSVTITLSPIALNGDCLIIPANYSKWNRSAFDEYFILELFSPLKNNAKDWSAWSKQYYDLGGYGVRLYHVDARLYNNWRLTDNNYDPSDTSRYRDFPLLRLIQAAGKNTFGNPSANSRHYLAYEDMFHEGDVFTFAKYAPMLSKYGNTPTTMDNGDNFPYTITFNEMSASYVTLTVSK